MSTSAEEPKVVLADGKAASCSAKVEVGADGVVAVPVTVWRSVKGGYRSLGFRLVFGAGADGKAVCEATDLTSVRDWVKKTGKAVVVGNLESLAAGLQTVTAREFKAYAVTVDPALTAAFGPVTKSSLRMTASTGIVSGTLKFGKVSGKATGVVVNGVGIGTVTVKQGKVTAAFAFVALPAK